LLTLDFANKLIGDKKIFVRTVTDSRNYFTHLGISKKTNVVEEIRDIFLLNQKLHAFLRCLMLLDLGFKEEEVRPPVLYQATKWK
jgi:hypothetical protein